MPATTKRIVYTTLAQTILRIIEIAIGVITLGLITRYLNPSGFGAFTTVNALLQFFVILVDFGLYLTFLREISTHEERMQSIANNIITLRFLSTGILLIISLVLISFSPYSTEIKQGTLFLSISFLASSLIATITALFQKQLRMVSIGVVNVFSKCAMLAATYLVVQQNFGLPGIFIGSSLVGCATIIALWFLLQRLPIPIRLTYAFDFTYWRHVIIRAWPIAVTTALNLVYFKADTIILSFVQSQESVGLYGAAYRVLEIIATFPHMFMGLILPLLTAAWIAHDTVKLERLWQRALLFFASITLPLIVGGFLIGTDVMIFLAGDTFAEAGPILAILMLATALIFFGTLYTYLVLVIDRQRSMIRYFFYTAVVSSIGYLLLIPRYSYWGAAWMTVISELMIVISAWIVIRKEVRLTIPWNPLFKILIASLGMGYITALLAGAFSLPVLICVSGAAYIILFLALRPIPAAELKQMIVG